MSNASHMISVRGKNMLVYSCILLLLDSAMAASSFMMMNVVTMAEGFCRTTQLPRASNLCWLIGPARLCAHNTIQHNTIQYNPLTTTVGDCPMLPRQ